MAGSYVITFELGPVGPFIQAARRSRDLAFGSWLLSDLARAAARALLAAGGELLAPHPDDVGSPDASIADVVTGLLDGGAADARRVGKAMAKAARDRLLAAWAQVEARLPSSIDGQQLDLARARAQVEDLLETAWVALPVEGDHVGRARARAARLRAARTARHPFGPPPHAAPVPKSSLGGIRESVVPESLYDAAARKPRIAAELFRRLGIGPAERIDGPGLLKRLGHRHVAGAGRGRQLSTSHLGAHDTLAILDRWPPPARAEAAEALQRHLERLREAGADLTEAPSSHPVLGSCDAHVLYASRMADLCGAAGRDEIEAARRSVAELFRAWRAIARRHDQPSPPRPHGYYAVLAADGDRLGALIAGLAAAGEHRDLAHRLTQFAAHAREAIAEARGHAIYAGGDDILALLPASSCLEVAARLAARIGRDLEGLGRPVTLSAGIVVAHHLGRYDHVLARAAATLEAAKAAGRNRWQLEVRKRSGAPLAISGGWDEVDLLQRPIRAWRSREEPLPRGLPGDLRDAALALPLGREPMAAYAAWRGCTEEQARARFLRIQQAELKRIARAKRLPQAQQRLLEELFDRARGAEDPLQQVSHRLVVARALSGLETGATR